MKPPNRMQKSSIIADIVCTEVLVGAPAAKTAIIWLIRTLKENSMAMKMKKWVTDKSRPTIKYRIEPKTSTSIKIWNKVIVLIQAKQDNKPSSDVFNTPRLREH